MHIRFLRIFFVFFFGGGGKVLGLFFGLMVRVKNRYLLSEMIWFDKNAGDRITPQLIARALRDEIKASFGDVALAANFTGLQGWFVLLVLAWLDY